MSLLRPFAWLALLCIGASALDADAQRRRDRSNEEEVATSQPEDPRQVDKLYHEAAIRQAQEIFDEALELYAEVLKLDPANHAARYNTARLHLAQRAPEKALPEAEEALKQARKADAATFWHYQLVSQCYQALGQYASAIKVLEEAISAHTGQLEARFELAELYIQAQAYDKALALYEALAQRTGFTEQIGMQRYRLLLRMGDGKKAVAVVRQLIEQFPENRTYYQTLYDTYVLLQANDEAEAVLDELLALEPTNPFALERRMERLVAARDWVGLRQLLQPAIAALNLPVGTKLALLQRLENVPAPEAQALVAEQMAVLADSYPNAPEIQVRLAQTALENGTYAAARTHSQNALAEDRTLEQAWDILLLADENLLRFDWLQADAYKALQAYPNQPKYNLAYATGARFQEDYSTALRYTDRFLLLAEGSPAQKLYVFILQAEAYAEDGDNTEALRTWEKALALVPDEPITLARYAASLVVLGDVAGARKALLKAQRDAPTSPWVQYATGRVAFAESAYSQAVAAFTAAFETRPSARIAEALGDAHAKAGNLEQARTYWTYAQAQGGNADRLAQKLRAN